MREKRHLLNLFLGQIRDSDKKGICPAVRKRLLKFGGELVMVRANSFFVRDWIRKGGRWRECNGAKPPDAKNGLTQRYIWRHAIYHSDQPHVLIHVHFKSFDKTFKSVSSSLKLTVKESNLCNRQRLLSKRNLIDFLLRSKNIWIVFQVFDQYSSRSVIFQTNACFPNSSLEIYGVVGIVCGCDIFNCNSLSKHSFQ